MLLATCIDHLKAQPSLIVFISFLGFLSFLKLFIISPLKWIFITFLRPPKNLTNYGSWALVTGSTDGIGKAFAFQLAKKGLHLILVGRNTYKLYETSREIKAMCPNTKIKTIVLDFSVAAKGLVEIIEKAIEGFEVGVLINNVGVTYPTAMFFHEVPEEVWMNLVRVNLEATTLVTRAVIQGMIQRKRGAIVNIGSGASNIVPSHPLYSIYAATKAYVDQLSRSLYVEYKHRGIDVQCQVPLYVLTNMTSKVSLIKKTSMFIPSADGYAKAAVRRIGYEARCTPYWAHSLEWFIASLVPEAALDAWRLSIGLNRRELCNKAN